MYLFIYLLFKTSQSQKFFRKQVEVSSLAVYWQPHEKLIYSGSLLG